MIICLSSYRGPYEMMGAKNMTMTEVQHARRIGSVQPGETGIGRAVLNSKPRRFCVRVTATDLVAAFDLNHDQNLSSSMRSYHQPPACQLGS